MERFAPVVEAIKKGRKFLVVSHVNPEGDAIGSLLGAALALRTLGRDVTAYLEDEIPQVYGFLPGADTVVHSLEGRGPFDVTVAVDCGHKDRLGRDFVALNGPGTIINIDHHATNDRFGDINVVVPDAGAAGELVYDMCVAAGIDITPEIATNLYVAIHTDTGSFRYSSSSADSFIKAGALVRLGAKPWEISKRVYESYPVEKFKLLGLVLPTLDVLDVTGRGPDGKVATLTATLDMFRSTGADKDLSDGFVNYARGIEGVEVGVLFRETGPGNYKVSLRAKGEVDVSLVAECFGGGGHKNAAGFNIGGSLDEVKRKVLDTLKEKMLLRAR